MWEAIVDRQLGFLNFSDELHQALKQTRVAVIGTGGNGAVLDFLVRVGFTKFEIVDSDVIEDTNLNRLPFTTDQIGRPKVEAWRDYLTAINPEAEVTPHCRIITRRDGDWAAELLGRVDLLTLGTTDPEANLVVSRIACRQGKRMVVGPGSSGSWVVGTFTHDDGLSLEKLAGFGVEDIPLDQIDYQALLPKYVKLVYYPGRDDKLAPGIKQGMIEGRIEARSCKIFVALVNSALCWEMVKNVALMNGLPLEGTSITALPVLQIFDPYRGAAYYYNLETGQIGLPNWLTGEIAWQDHQPGGGGEKNRE